MIGDEETNLVIILAYTFLRSGHIIDNYDFGRPFLYGFLDPVWKIINNRSYFLIRFYKFCNRTRFSGNQ